MLSARVCVCVWARTVQLWVQLAQVGRDGGDKDLDGSIS